ncbi:Peptidase [Oryctes borbonicus]|uniref:folate gamma-glutamyl hydrolase n=1 Tax=Oryctes borbonicus TaxID=1629725 RepID=A0A0T6B392_9SCAR|nr:Peptidase [Oryctes borbonicus]
MQIDRTCTFLFEYIRHYSCKLMSNTKSYRMFCISQLKVHHSMFYTTYFYLATTDAPIIGILSQETFSVNDFFPQQEFHSFIAASYVKFVESAGARAVPIMIGREKEYYEDLVNCTNGILFPGGATYFNQSNGYADAGQIIYNLAVNINNEGHYYPLWGTCLGMELLIYVALNGREVRSDCSAKRISTSLNFKTDIETSKLFRNAPSGMLDKLSRSKIVYNSNIFCLPEETFEQNGLLKDWRILATSKDRNNFEFVSVFESRKYPFYGVQFHPEKANFEFREQGDIPHSLDAIT